MMMAAAKRRTRRSMMHHFELNICEGCWTGKYVWKQYCHGVSELPKFILFSAAAAEASASEATSLPAEKQVGVWRGAWTGLNSDELVQERRNSSALAMELRLSCTNPSIRQCLKKQVKKMEMFVKKLMCNIVFIAAYYFLCPEKINVYWIVIWGLLY